MLEPGSAVSATSMALAPWESPEPGAPATSLATVAVLGGTEIGVWEHSPGRSEDLEEDEVFVVLSGAATLEFVEPRRPALSIGPGDIVRLAAGERTIWDVTATLRKVYLCSAEDDTIGAATARQDTSGSSR